MEDRNRYTNPKRFCGNRPSLYESLARITILGKTLQLLIYKKKEPSEPLNPFIECFWFIDSLGHSEVEIQKIIPDGFPETIFHFKEPYEININNSWQIQPALLLAGQFTQHFQLRNTGQSGMLGIKWKPTALAQLFGINMAEITNQVIPLPKTLEDLFSEILKLIELRDQSILEEVNHLMEDIVPPAKADTLAARASNKILECKGAIHMSELANQLNCHERTLEREFKKSIGLTAKRYARIIRLGHVFELMQSGNNDWSDLVYKSGFYDQSHFIKNFKEFTGEDPTNYGFKEKNMANFHLTGKLT